MKHRSYLSSNFTVAAFVMVVCSLALPAIALAESTAGAPSGDGVQPTVALGNQTCSDLGFSDFELKIQPVENGTFTDPNTGFEVIIQRNGKVFDWSSNQGVDAVFVKGGEDGNLYIYSPEDTADTSLHAPLNSNNNKFFGLSHLSFCYDQDDPIARVTKACQVGTDPVIDTDGVTVITTFDVIIANDGAAPLFDVAIKEDVTFDDLSGNFPAAFPATEECEITAVNGVPVEPVNLLSGVWTDIPGAAADQIAANASVTVEVTCDTRDSPLINQVTAGGNATDNQGINPPELIDGSTINDASTGGGVACAPAPTPMISLSKQCRDVRLMTTVDEFGDTILVAEVLVDITVTNTGVEQLDLVTVTDDKLASPVLVNATLAPTGQAGSSITVTGLSYMPSAPNQPPVYVCGGTDDPAITCSIDSDCPSGELNACAESADKYDSSSAMFTDTADASGVGSLSGSTANATQASVTCDLCPVPD